MKAGILYISYDGMLEPLGQSQVLSYLEKLSRDFRVHLISFEKRDDWDRREVRLALTERIASAGISWHPLRYHSRPTVPATAWDLTVGAATAIRQIRTQGISLIHARSYVPGLMGLAAKRTTGAKLLFDIRGFWADERVDGGIWPASGRLFKSAKRVERALFRAADHVVTLTRASEAEIGRFDYLNARRPTVTVIPTCADLARFHPRPTRADAFTLGWVGTAGIWYAFDEFLAVYRLLLEREPNAKLLIVNRKDQDYIRQRLAAANLGGERVELRTAEHAEVPALIARVSAGVAFYKPTYSKLATAPTKLAEYLGCGKPCLVNRGVGDVEAIVEDNRVGVCLPDFSPSAMASGVERLLRLAREPELPDRCAATAHSLFSLERGVASYRHVYDRLLTSR